MKAATAVRSISELTPAQRRLVLALIDAARHEAVRDPEPAA